MNVVLWILAGGFAGWVAFRYIGANALRGLMTSVVIGVCGAYFGGSVLEPLLGEAGAVADTINPIALMMALASAAVCLTVGDMVSRRFNV